MADAQRCREGDDCCVRRRLGADQGPSAIRRNGSRDGGPIGHHGPFSQPRPDHVQPADCGCRAHSGDPHYEPVVGKDAAIGKNDLVLVDLWAKLDRPRSVYSDLTRMGFVGDTVPEKYESIFAVVAAARDAAIKCVARSLRRGPAASWLGSRRGRTSRDRSRRIRPAVHP